MSTPAPSPWTVHRTKRKSTPLTPASTTRKRPKTFFEGQSSVDNHRRSKQQTLTQIDWVPSSRNVSFTDDGGDLEYLDHARPLAPNAKSRTGQGSLEIGNKHPSLRKSDSTLTQMEFFDRGIVGDPGALAEHYLNLDEQAQEAAGSAAHERSRAASPNPIPQVDGGHDSPRKKRRKRETSLDLVGNVSTDDEYQPSIKKQKSSKRAQPNRQEKKTRRTSGRLAQKILSDPEENLQYFAKALTDDKTDRNPNTSPKPTNPPRLEIKDTYGESDEQDDPVSATLLMRGQATPVTHKHYQVIPSSQSPESLPASCQKTVVRNNLTATRRTSKRQPLHEISANTPRRHRIAQWDKIPSYQSTVSPSPKRKICILKIPTITNITSNATDEAPETSIWSIPVTSSPEDDETTPPQLAAGSVGDNLAARPEIPGTSQTEIDLEKNASAESNETDSLRSLSDLLGLNKTPRTGGSSLARVCSAEQPPLGEPEVVVRDFALLDAQATALTPRRVKVSSPGVENISGNVRQQPHNPVVESLAQDSDGDSSFGSPVRNDTQFNTELAARSSSPREAIGMQSPYEHQEPRATGSTQPASGERHDSIQDLPMPPPRLVSHSTTSLVPLNDVNEEPELPTPPMASTQPTLPTQRLARPAEMPRQSQISTQDPTQNGMQMSSLPPLRAADFSEDAERITVKDSSSMRVPMSQVPHYEDEASQQDVDLELSEHDEEEDLDLDQNLAPSPVTHHPTTRAQFGSQTIHSDDGPAPDRTVDDAPTSSAPSSSPDPNEPNFTQGGHPTALRMKRMRRQGLIPKDYVPQNSFWVPKMPAWYFDDPFESQIEPERKRKR